jgi:hypothetical protein
MDRDMSIHFLLNMLPTYCELLDFSIILPPLKYIWTQKKVDNSL